MLSQDNGTSESIIKPPKVRVGRQEIPTEDAQPEISVEKKGDVISQVTIKCQCGQEINIDCQYPESN